MVLDASLTILMATTFMMLMLLIMTTFAVGLWLFRLIWRRRKVAIDECHVKVGHKDGNDPKEWYQKRPIPLNNKPVNLLKKIEYWRTSQEHHSNVVAKSKTQKVWSEHCPQALPCDLV
jgi:hypothetical protein